MLEATCERCGYRWTIYSSRKPARKCKSCRTRKVQTVQGVIGKCFPWHGHFLDDMVTPVDDNGQIVLPGRRLCYMLDCVNPAHIERDENG